MLFSLQNGEYKTGESLRARPTAAKGGEADRLREGGKKD